MVICLRPIGLGCAGFVSTSLDACSGQVDAVNPKRIKMSFSCDGLRLLPLCFFVSTDSASSSSFVRLTFPSGLSFLVFVLEMLLHLMQCLLSWRFERLTTVFLRLHLPRGAACTC